MPSKSQKINKSRTLTPNIKGVIIVIEKTITLNNTEIDKFLMYNVFIILFFFDNHFNNKTSNNEIKTKITNIDT